MYQNYFYKTNLSKIPERSITDKCIVLDLDETLVHTCGESNIDTLKKLNIFSDPKDIDLRRRIYKIVMDDVVNKKGEGIKTEMWGITRPHLTEFLIWCFTYFKIVAVWSAGKDRYVNSIVDFIFKDIKRPHVVWTYNELDKLSDNTLIKPLSKMINGVPGLSKYMSLDNTVIVDDRNSVYYVPNPHNGIQIPAYRPNFNTVSEEELSTIISMRTDDTALKQLMTWFNTSEVKASQDIKTVDKSGIFVKN